LIYFPSYYYISLSWKVKRAIAPYSGQLRRAAAVAGGQPALDHADLFQIGEAVRVSAKVDSVTYRKITASGLLLPCRTEAGRGDILFESLLTFFSRRFRIIQ
jgi:hypothetical protein